MPYVKISDPAILDLTAWTQVINVVNQHSDSISALTNNFGLSYAAVPESADPLSWRSAFDFGSCIIQFGRAKNPGAQAAGGTFYEDVTFPNSFSSKPIVTATVYQSGTNNDTNSSAIVSIINIQSSGFTYRIKTPTNSFGSNIYVNWIAVGPKA